MLEAGDPVAPPPEEVAEFAFDRARLADYDTYQRVVAEEIDGEGN